MYQFTVSEFEHFFTYLQSLDCFFSNQEQIASEIDLFAKNKDRHISVFIGNENLERLTYKAPYLKILYILKGEILIEVEGKTQIFKAGSLILADKWTIIDYTPQTKETTVISFYFKDEYFEGGLLNQIVEETSIYDFLVNNLGDLNDQSVQKEGHYYIYSFNPESDVHFYILILLKQILKMKYYDSKLTKSAFILLLMEMSYMSDTALIVKNSSLSKDVLVKEILIYIESHLQDLSLRELAETFNFHPNYLSSLIKKDTDKSYSEWLTYYRMRDAKFYLAKTNLSIQEILEKVGYSDKTFFFKLFKEHVGMTPKKYRTFMSEG